MKKYLKYLKLRYLIIGFLLIITFCNGTAIKIYKNYIEYYRLNRDVKVLTKQNLEHKKRLYYLENKPSYLERKAKFELNVIAQDEIEYRFHDKSKENK